MVLRYDAGAFHFPAEIPRSDALFAEVERLRADGRPGAALDAVLDVLRVDPGSADAFECALLLCAGRTDGDAAVPITIDQLGDPLLGPIRTVCHGCGAAWFSAHVLFPGLLAGGSDPIGLQCQDCRCTRCRDCLEPGDLRCPQDGCAGELGTPVLATGIGLPPESRAGRVEYLLVMWEGTAPGPDQLGSILDSVADGQDIADAGITVLGSPTIDDQIGWISVLGLERDGKVGTDALNRTRTLLLETPGLGRQRCFVVEAVSGTGSRGPAPRRSRARRLLRWPGRRR